MIWFLTVILVFLVFGVVGISFFTKWKNAEDNSAEQSSFQEPSQGAANVGNQAYKGKSRTATSALESPRAREGDSVLNYGESQHRSSGTSPAASSNWQESGGHSPMAYRESQHTHPTTRERQEEPKAWERIGRLETYLETFEKRVRRLENEDRLRLNREGVVAEQLQEMKRDNSRRRAIVAGLKQQMETVDRRLFVVEDRIRASEKHESRLSDLENWLNHLNERLSKSEERDHRGPRLTVLPSDDSRRNYLESLISAIAHLERAERFDHAFKIMSIEMGFIFCAAVRNTDQDTVTRDIGEFNSWLQDEGIRYEYLFPQRGEGYDPEVHEAQKRVNREYLVGKTITAVVCWGIREAAAGKPVISRAKVELS